MAMRPETLKGTVIVMAGASSGLGRGAAVKLAQKGPIVIIAARRKDILDEVVAEITIAGGAALAVQMDISNATCGFR